jgi:type IV secretion system protein VirD4
MMLDEFPALGRLDFFETSLAFMAGYGIRAFLIAQSLNQIEKAYGEHNSILDNCHVRVAFATNDERTAKRISDALGMATEQRAMRNYAGHRLAPWLAHVMVSRQETARPLLTPGEVMQLPPEDELVLLSGHAPIRAMKLRYYADRNFAARVFTPPQLADGGYPDRPAQRPDGWAKLLGKMDKRLEPVDSEVEPQEPDGLEQQRHPGLPDAPNKYLEAEPEIRPELAGEDDDIAADSHAMDQARGLSAVARGYALDRDHADLLPGF